MRLPGCLLLELVLAVALVGGASAFGLAVLGHHRAPAGAGSSAVPPGRRRPPEHVGLRPRQELSAEAAADTPAIGSATFLGMSDDLLLERLRTQPVTRLKLNRGGSSLSFRVDFADGSRAAWKPAQTNAQTVPRKEVAAYRLNRLLELGAVPPAVPRALSRDDLFGLLHPDSAPALPRIRAETIVGPNGMISGEASYWIPVIKDSELDNPEGRQEVVTWLTQGEPVPFARRAMAAQMSAVVVFDFLTNNPDRYSGSNLKTSPDGSRLYFMDNTMSFFLDPEGTEKNRQVLLRTQRFSRALHQALSRLELPTLQAVLHEADGTEILTEAEMRAVVMRRQFVQRHVADLVKQFGEREVLCFP